MKRFSEQFKKKSDSIRLTARQRSDLRDRLTSYMEYHPLPAEMKTSVKTPIQKQVEGIVSEPFKAISINMIYVRSFAGVFAIFMVVGVPIIAEKAVPGDMLYAVKTEITEELRASLKLSPYAKVEWETERLERRVAEARLLASEGKLTAETQAVVAEAVQEHTDAVNLEIATIRETDEDDAAIAEIAFASALSVQSEVLEGHIANEENIVEESEEGHSIAALADVVSGVSEDADTAQADAAPSYEALLGGVETETTRAYELFQSVQKRADAEEIADIERRLEDVERKLVEAIVLQNGETLSVEVFVPEESVSEEEVIGEAIPEEPIQLSVSEESETQEDKGTEEAGSATDVTLEPEIVVEEEASMPVKDTLIEETPEERTAQAIALLRLALTDVQKLIIFMTDIDVRENLTVEELVPVTATPEERTKKILTQLDIVLLIESDIESRFIPEELLEKVAVGTELLTGQLESVASMLEEGNLDGAEKVIAQVSEVARDVQKLVANLPKMELAVEELEELEELEKLEKLEETEEVTDEAVPVELESGETTVSDEVPVEEVTE